MVAMRVLLAGMCLSCLLAAIDASLIVALAALKGAFIGAALKTKLLAKSGIVGGYVTYDDHYHAVPHQSVPHYAVLHYHTGPTHHYDHHHDYTQHYGHHGWHHKGHYIHPRSLKGETEGNSEDNLLLRTVSQLDPDDCILKLLCILQTKAKDSLSPHEAILARMFSDDAKTSYNTAFVHATGVGRQTSDPTSCKKFFSQCPLEDKQLSSVLESAWGCGLDGQ